MNTAAMLTVHPARSAKQINGDSPQWNVPKSTYWPGIPVGGTLAANPATWGVAAVWNYFGLQATIDKCDFGHTKSLHFKSILDQSFHKHESPPRYLVSFAPSK